MKKRCSVKPYDGNEKYIFISYCHKDRAQVFPIIEQLAKDGYRIWYDEGIDPGSEWPEIIASHLNKSAICIAFITENALNSHNCRREINFALMKMKKLISVILESVEMSLGMEMQLSATQSVFKYKLSGTDEFFSKLYSAHDMDECKGAPDNTIVVSKPEDYEPEDYSDKREPFSDKWFVEDISDKKKPTAVSVAIETAPAQAPEPLPVESAPAQDAEPLPAETAPAQVTEPLPVETAPAKDPEPLSEESAPAQDAEPLAVESAPAQDPEPLPAETAPAQVTEPLPAETAPAQDPEPLPAESAPAQGPEPISAQSKSKFAKDVDALFAKSEADNAHPDDIKAAESEEIQPAKAVYDADDADDATVEKKKKLPLWIKIAAIAAAAIAAAAAVLLLIKANNDGQAVYVAESEYSDENTDDSSDSSANEEQSDASEESSAASDTSSTSKEDDTSSADATQTDKTDSSSPKWEETEVSGVKYVTVDCYSRKEAVVGSKRVELHKQGSSVKIIAKTDTDYYKLEDGSFIHKDYLSDTDPSQSTSQPQTQKPAETEKPQTQKPVTEKPQTQKPATEKPQTQGPSGTEEPDYEGIYYTDTLSDGTLSIAYYGGSEQDVVIPEKIDGKQVTMIGEWAFSSNDFITSVTIPSGVTNIEEAAFINCAKLKSVKLSKNLTFIGSNAFKDCVSLPSIDLPNGLVTIKDQAFTNCSSLKSLVIPDSVIYLGHGAFNFCSSLTSVKLSKSLEQIDVATFAYCDKLSSVEIPENVSSILDSAFSQSPNLTSITVNKNNKYFSSQDGVLFNKDKTLLIRCPEGIRGEYKIPDSVVETEDFAFENCNKITSVIIPKKIIIGESAFYECDNISDVFYKGSLDEWYALRIKSGNELLYDAELHTDYKG